MNIPHFPVCIYIYIFFQCAHDTVEARCNETIQFRREKRGGGGKKRKHYEQYTKKGPRKKKHAQKKKRLPLLTSFWQY